MRADKAIGRKRLRIMVLLGMGSAASRAIIKGILRYAATDRRLEVLVRNREAIPGELTDIGDWRPDGILVGETTLTATVPSSVRAAVVVHGTGAVPFAGTGHGPAALPGGIVQMQCDDAAVGRLAAEHLLRHNMRNFGCVVALNSANWSAAREKSFAEAVREAGFEVKPSFRVEGGMDLTQERKALAAWMKGLPKPCGIFAVSDWRAWHVLDVCRECGIEVPHTAQVLGVDNEEYICEQTMPTLSSIEPDFEGGGYEAMHVLVAMLSGRGAPDARIVYGIRGLVERQSTRDDRGTARLVNRALDFIRLHAASGGTAAEAVKAAGCSASLLQRHFRKTVGRTVTEEIHRVRLEKACKLLRRTDTPIGEIAALCGYKDEIFLKVLFRRTFGQTMRDYRASVAAKT